MINLCFWHISRFLKKILLNSRWSERFRPCKRHHFRAYGDSCDPLTLLTPWYKRSALCDPSRVRAGEAAVVHGKNSDIQWTERNALMDACTRGHRAPERERELRKGALQETQGVCLRVDIVCVSKWNVWLATYSYNTRPLSAFTCPMRMHGR